MKKIIVSLLFITGLLFTIVSCEKDEDKATASLITDTKLTAPVTGTTIQTNPLQGGAVATTIQWTSADFGYSASVKYVLQVINESDTFDTATKIQSIPLGTLHENDNTTHAFGVSTTVLNTKLYALLNSTTSGAANFKIRVFGQPANQLIDAPNGVRTYSGESTFTSNVYDPIEETPFLYVYGNFGAASTYTDWSINMDGTSNSPVIYSPKSDDKYSGFVYMNDAAPQFKFANPTSTSLNVKGLGATAYNPATPTIPGVLQASTDISTGNVIPAPVSADKTFYITADYTNNEYTVISRKISVKGPSTGNVAKYLSYDTDPTSPYYRMYKATMTLNPQQNNVIQLKDAAGVADQIGLTTGTTVLISPNASSIVKNPLTLGGGNKLQFNSSGTYTVVLDLRNSATYNLMVIRN